ncbi:MAG: hypothetical protein R3B47_02975 [Bacteroidia bacterium]
MRIEKNFFHRNDRAVRIDMSAAPGAMHYIDNVWISSPHTASPNCVLPVPYDFSSCLDSVNDVPEIIRQVWGSVLAVDEKIGPGGFEVSWMCSKNG